MEVLIRNSWIIAYGLIVIVVQLKNMKHILWGEILSNIFLVFFMGSWFGWRNGLFYLVAAVQTGILILLSKKTFSDKTENMLIVVFSSVYIAITVIWNPTLYGLIWCTYFMLYILAVVQKNTAKYRKVKVLHVFMGLVVDVIQGFSVGSSLMHWVLVIVSLVIGVLRMDRENK